MFIFSFMDGNEFCKRFQLASYFCRDFTDRHITKTLPETLSYSFALSDRIKNDQEKIFLSGQYYLKNQLENLSPKDAAKILFREGFFPVWIDLYVGGFDDEKTIIEVTFSEDFTDVESDLFHQKEGYPPFHVVGPTAPKEWRSLEEDGVFPFIRFY